LSFPHEVKVYFLLQGSFFLMLGDSKILNALKISLSFLRGFLPGLLDHPEVFSLPGLNAAK
ncbi:MAG: hypothetical protein L0Y73_00650, partial [Candidatus Aminicenantes bacterium]|nr:hypothetical protein [Candidatus Aminicenantes bacterium]